MRRGTLAVVTLVATLAAATSAEAVTGPIVVAGGLDNPRGMSFGPDGSLFIAEAGRAGPRCTRDRCAGATGAIARLVGGRLARVHKGLVSAGRRGGVDVTGPSDVGVAQVSGRIYTVVGTTPAVPRGLSARLSRQLGKMLRVNAISPGSVEILAGLARPGGRSDPSGVAILGMERYVADTAANRLLLERDGNVSVAASFPSAAPGAPSAPSAVRVGPDGALYVGELTGDRAPAGRARVWRVVAGQPPQVFASGFTRITALAFGPDGSLYVTQSRRRAGGRGLQGDVVRRFPDGRRTVVSRGKLSFPGGIAVRGDGVIFVSNYSTLPGRPAARGPLRGRTGQIVRFNP
jgi:hypothetical protein